MIFNIGVFTIFCINVIIDGFVFSILYKWFLASIFGLPCISIFTAIGLVLLFRFVMITRETDKKNTKLNKEFFERISMGMASNICFSLFVLLLGWVVHLFI